MAAPRPLFLALSLVFVVEAVAARELHPVAPPGSGPLPGIATKVSVAFGPDAGVAVWRIESAGVWDAPLDRDGRQTAPARLILARSVGWPDPEVRYFGGSFNLWWQENYPQRTYLACRACVGELRYVSADGSRSGVIFSNGHDPAWRP